MKHRLRSILSIGIVFCSAALFAVISMASLARAETSPNGAPMTAAGLPAEGSIEPFLGEPKFDIQQIFEGERFPNVIVATDGAVLATWGSQSYKIRRSEDGGETWGPEIVIADPGFHGGGALVGERSGNVFVFVDETHPPRTPQETMGPLFVYRSEDHGVSWEEIDVVIHPDRNGYYPSMHMCERGITLRHGPKAGRLLRPARVYNDPQGYNNAIFSDDGGNTWHPSAPFPAEGTGEGTLAELSDGRIYYNSRRHWASEGENARMRWIAWSEDSGETWMDLTVSDALPDGAQHRDYGLMGGLVRLPVQGHDILVFSNIESPEGRVGGTVWVSFDGGDTWPLKRLVDEGNFAYSSLSVGRPGTPSDGWIYLFYEGRGDARMARFNLAWLTEGHDWQNWIEQ